MILVHDLVHDKEHIHARLFHNSGSKVRSSHCRRLFLHMFIAVCDTMPGHMQYHCKPVIVGLGLVYCLDRQITLISVSDARIDTEDVSFGTQ